MVTQIPRAKYIAEKYNTKRPCATIAKRSPNRTNCLFFCLFFFVRKKLGHILISRSLLEKKAKNSENYSNWVFSFFYGLSFKMAFLSFFGSHFLDFISMLIRYIATILLGQEPNNPNEKPGDPWHRASLLCPSFLDIFSSNLSTTHASVWLTA